MNIVELFRKKRLESSNKIFKEYLKAIDSYTGIDEYFEIIINVSTNEIVCNRSSRKDVEYKDYIMYCRKSVFGNGVQRAVEKNMDKFKNRFNDDPNNLSLSTLYNPDMKNEFYKNEYNKYINVLKLLELKCRENGIQVNLDNHTFITNVISKINSSREEFSKENGFLDYDKIDYCYSEDSINEEVKKEINSKFNYERLSYDRRYLCTYFGAFIEKYPYLLDVLNKDILDEKDKNILKTYCEFFKVIPYLVSIINCLEDGIEKIRRAKLTKDVDKYKSDKNFISEINGLLSEVDIDKEDLYLHSTTSLDASKSIIEKGLYTFGKDLDSFCENYRSVEQILKYQYGSETNMTGNYVVIIGFPKDKTNIIELNEEEQKEAMGFIDTRRGFVAPPSYLVPSENILGVVDKKNLKVIKNPNYKKIEDVLEK